MLCSCSNRAQRMQGPFGTPTNIKRAQKGTKMQNGPGGKRKLGGGGRDGEPYTGCLASISGEISARRRELGDRDGEGGLRRT